MRASVSLFLWWHFGAFVVKMGRKGRNKSRVERVVRWKEARAGWGEVDQVSFCSARSPGEATEERVVGLTFRNVVKFGSNVSKDHDTHMVSIEISFKGVHNMHFLLSE